MTLRAPPFRSGAPSVDCAARRREGHGGRGRGCARRRGAQGPGAGLPEQIRGLAPVPGRPGPGEPEPSRRSRRPGTLDSGALALLPRRLRQPPRPRPTRATQPGTALSAFRSRKPCPPAPLTGGPLGQLERGRAVLGRGPAPPTNGRPRRADGRAQGGACAGPAECPPPALAPAARSRSRTRRGRSPCAGRAARPGPRPRPGGCLSSERWDRTPPQCLVLSVWRRHDGV